MLGCNRHITQWTSPIPVVSQQKLVSVWPSATETETPYRPIWLSKDLTRGWRETASVKCQVRCKTLRQSITNNTDTSTNAQQPLQALYGSLHVIPAGLPGWAGTTRNIHPLTPILIINHPLPASSIYYELVPYSEFWCKMKITQVDTPTTRMDCHPIQTNWCPHLCHPVHFHAGCPTLHNPPNLGQAQNMLACIPGGLVPSLTPAYRSHPFSSFISFSAFAYTTSLSHLQSLCLILLSDSQCVLYIPIQTMSRAFVLFNMRYTWLLSVFRCKNAISKILLLIFHKLNRSCDPKHANLVAWIWLNGYHSVQLLHLTSHLIPYHPSSIHGSSYSSNVLQVPPRTNPIFGSCSFHGAAPTMWSSLLPNSIRSSETFRSFRWHFNTALPSSFHLCD